MDSSKLDDGVKVLELADAIQQAIIAQSTPKDRNDAPSGAWVDPEEQRSLFNGKC